MYSSSTAQHGGDACNTRLTMPAMLVAIARVLSPQLHTQPQGGNAVQCVTNANLLLAPSPVPIVLSEAVLKEVVHGGAPTLINCLLDVHLTTEVTLRPLVLVWDDGRRYRRTGLSLGAHLQGNNTTANDEWCENAKRRPTGGGASKIKAGYRGRSQLFFIHDAADDFPPCSRLLGTLPDHTSSQHHNSDALSRSIFEILIRSNRQKRWRRSSSTAISGGRVCGKMFRQRYVGGSFPLGDLDKSLFWPEILL